MAAHAHSPGFLALVEEARRRVREIDIPEYEVLRARRDHPALLDVREDREWDASRLPGAIHLGKGVIERDIEKLFPDPAAPIVCYCGGGYRSALVCENLQRMGYTNVRSLKGGYRGWVESGRPVESDPVETDPVG
jgi:rhodanese-related sulfurtransferase